MFGLLLLFGSGVGGSGGIIIASASALPTTFGRKNKVPTGLHHPSLLTIGTGSPSAGSPSVVAGNGASPFNTRQSCTIQNQHASATVSIFFGLITNPAYLLAAGQSVIDYSQDPIYLQSSSASTSVLVDPVY